jgi:hypothetical protein
MQPAVPGRAANTSAGTSLNIYQPVRFRGGAGSTGRRGGSAWEAGGAAGACRQRLTLVHFLAQLEHVLWDTLCLWAGSMTRIGSG